LPGIRTWPTDQGDLEAAQAAVEQAVKLGLPAERFLAGPRGLLGPLLDYEPFQQFVAGKYTEPIHGPMLGTVTDHSARFWMRTASELPVAIQVSTRPSFDNPVVSETVSTGSEREFTAVLEIARLEPRTQYHYRAMIDGKPDERVYQFRTYPATDEPAAFRVGFGGGAGYVPEHEHMWNVINDHEPIAFLLLGDNVYIDKPDYPDLQRYCYLRRQSRPEFRKFSAEACIYAIYDDHDFADNDCWNGPLIELPPWKRPVWRLFSHSWVNPYYGGGEEQPGCWFHARIADVDFIFLDCRYYRTTPRRSDRSMLGPVQKDWLFDRLKQSDGQFVVVSSSVPWASGTKPGSLDTWDGFPEEREEIFSFIEANMVEGVVLLSADRHRSDAWKIERPEGYDFYEFESSRLTNQHVHKTMDKAVLSYNEKQSFGMLDFDTTKDDPTVTYTIVSIDGEHVHTLEVKRSQLRFER